MAARLAPGRTRPGECRVLRKPVSRRICASVVLLAFSELTVIENCSQRKDNHGVKILIMLYFFG